MRTAAAGLLVLVAVAGCGTAAGQVVDQAHDNAGVQVVDERTAAPGYVRPGWKDVDRNRCSTRNDVLGAQMDPPRYKTGSRCVVVGGSLQDPYTGRLVPFADVQIDHVFPLRAAWDLGAATWLPARFVEFANDPDNLLAVDGRTNAAKGDQTPGTWLPINQTFRCEYVRRYLAVALEYGLPITKADAESVRLLNCNREDHQR